MNSKNNANILDMINDDDEENSWGSKSVSSDENKKNQRQIFKQDEGKRMTRTKKLTNMSKHLNELTFYIHKKSTADKDK
jgi:hypothetical protein